MLGERFRLMYVSKDGTEIKQIILSTKKFYTSAILSILGFIGLTLLATALFNRIYHNYRIMTLENDRQHLQGELLTIKEKVVALNDRISNIESTGDQLRNVANLPPIDQDMRMAGVGGPSSYNALDFGYYPDEVSKTAKEIQLDLNKLERAIRLEKSSFKEIASKLKEDEKKRLSYPSICPILGGVSNITSRFGWRIHPLTGRRAEHKGVDIYARKGTQVLASAGGYAELVQVKYTPHKDYGMQVVINHGYGFKTRYAHLSKILIKQGERVKRWQPIGLVGATGATSGEHLHYEVIYNEEPMNPEYFLYN